MLHKMGKHKKKIKDTSDKHSKVTADGDKYLNDEGHNVDFSTNTLKTESENEAVSSKKSKKKKDKEKRRRFSFDKDDEFNPTGIGKGSKLETECSIEAHIIPIGHHEHGLSSIEDSNSNHKTGKKKKSKKKEGDLTTCTQYNISEHNSGLTVSSKKRKRSEWSENCGHINDSTFDLDESVIQVKNMEEEMEADGGKVKKKKHKSKKSSKENEHSEDTVAEVDVPEVKPVKKKKKKQDKVKEHNASPKDSTDHFNLNSKHVTTLHESGKIISTESLNPNEKVSNSENKPVAGQWGTNAFEDEAKQNKFLRLLGGFKKGADKTSIHQKMFDQNRSTNNSSFGSPKFAGTMAMNKHQQETYKKTMESEYESAMSMHLNRGTGLGFQSPRPTKKFSIDTQTSKSIKLDDSD